MGLSFERIARMSSGELLWRCRSAAQVGRDCLRTGLRQPRWNRRALVAALSDNRTLRHIRAAAAGERWLDAHRALCDYVSDLPHTFIIAPHSRRELVDRIRRNDPESPAQASGCADRLIAGKYDLLGYRELCFEEESASSGNSSRDGVIDWQFDPVHKRRPPKRFWAAVPYLSPESGDHKIIWELNRHQHWLTLGRAFWLTGGPQYRERTIAELASWLAANPPLIGINWASMLELALRSISWIWALNFFALDATQDGSPWAVDLLVGLDRQLNHVHENLSYYFSPNTHLLGEALGLYAAGLGLPILARSSRWAATGRHVLLTEARRQIASDGGHLERSTHYHRYTLDFYLIALVLARINDDPAAQELECAVRSLAWAARLLADNRGRLPHIGDDDGGAALPICRRAVDDISDSLAAASVLLGRRDFGVGSIPEETLWLLAHPIFAPLLTSGSRSPIAEAPGSSALPKTGYYISRSASGTHLVFDGGPHGYMNGGHAHADALSITLSVRATPLLIDPGTACYTIDSTTRDRFRSTAMHNTVVIDDRPASVPCGPFHWQRAAQATTHRWRPNGAFDYIDASHDGYSPVEHRRRVLIVHDDLLVVADRVGGDGIHRADVHWTFDRRWHLDLTARTLVFTARGLRVGLVIPRGSIEVFAADEETGLGWNAPVYGRVEAATTVRIRRTGLAPLWIVSVFGLDPANAIEGVELLPVWAEAGVLDQSLAVRIARRATVDQLLIAETAPSPSTGDRLRTRWRMGVLETDAHMLFCRTNRDGAVARVALVDGSTVKASGGARLLIDLAEPAADFHLDLLGGGRSESMPAAQCSGHRVAARVRVGGRELAVATDGPLAPRTEGAR